MMKMTSVFNRRVKSKSPVLRLFSNSCSPDINRTSYIYLLINQGNPYLELFSTERINNYNVGLCVKKIFFPLKEGPLYVCGPCNGVICVYSNWEHVSLLNPATRYIKHYTLPNWKDFHSAQVHSFGFGFDSKTSDFKIVRSITCDYWDHDKLVTWNPSFGVKDIQHVQTISLNDMEVREIKVLGEIRAFRPSRTGTTPNINGVCYWSAKRLCDLKMKVLSFDFADEVFDLFTLPPCGYANYVLDTEDCLMCSFDGFPAAIRYDMECRDKVFEVWVKRESTWVKGMSIGPISCVIKPLCFLHNNQGLILLGSDYNLILYDFVEEELSELAPEILNPLAAIQEKEPISINQFMSLPGKNLWMV